MARCSSLKPTKKYRVNSRKSACPWLTTPPLRPNDLSFSTSPSSHQMARRMLLDTPPTLLSIPLCDDDNNEGLGFSCSIHCRSSSRVESDNERKAVPLLDYECLPQCHLQVSWDLKWNLRGSSCDSKRTCWWSLQQSCLGIQTSCKTHSSIIYSSSLVLSRDDWHYGYLVQHLSRIDRTVAIIVGN